MPKRGYTSDGAVRHAGVAVSVRRRPLSNPIIDSTCVKTHRPADPDRRGKLAIPNHLPNRHTRQGESAPDFGVSYQSFVHVREN